MVKTSVKDKGNHSDSSIPLNEFFNKQWALYQKVLAHNYMGHQEVYKTLHHLLRNRYGQQPFKLLDLGCGDANFVAQALQETSIHTYCGVDLSAPALEIAQENTASLPGHKSFVQADLFEWVLQTGASQNTSDHQTSNGHTFDVILASFALHHLSLERKEQLISRLKSLLNEQGVFLLIDIIRSPHESREAYIKRYLAFVRRDWQALTPEEFLMVDDHISSSDFPETQATLFAIAQKHHFSQADCLYQDSLETTQLLCFQK